MRGKNTIYLFWKSDFPWVTKFFACIFFVNETHVGMMILIQRYQDYRPCFFENIEKHKFYNTFTKNAAAGWSNFSSVVALFCVLGPLNGSKTRYLFGGNRYVGG